MTFNGFISYSHAADGRLAPAVQRGLHRLAKPWHRRRALWIFRDQTGLAVTPALWSSIRSALDGSDYFVLLASPEAARSAWVNREIEHWIATKPADRILAVVTDGEWQWDRERRDFTDDSTAVPAALRGAFAEEPLFLDLRWARGNEHLSLQHSRFRDAIAQLAAPMHGVSKDELEGEDVRQHRRMRRIRSGAVSTLVALTVLATVTGLSALRNAERASASAAEAVRQQKAAAEQRSSAERFADESRRQQDNARRQQDVARRQQARAASAAAEAQRQERSAREQERLADRAAVEARRQQRLADRAATRTQEQRRLARKASEQAQRLAAEAQRLARAAEDQRRQADAQRRLAQAQQRLADEQQRLAEAAALEAGRQQAKADQQQVKADQQQRIAVSRRLVNQAKVAVGNDPGSALMLAAAAQAIRPDTGTRSQVAGIVASTQYAGTLGQVTSAAYARDGVLATVNRDGTASLWNVDDRTHPVRIAGLGDADTGDAAVTFSPDGRKLAVAGTSGAAVLWDVRVRSRPVRVASLPSPGRVMSLAFSPDGRTVATGDMSGVTVLWDASGGRLAQIGEPNPIRPLGVRHLAFSPDGRTLVQNRSRFAAVHDVSDRASPVPVGDVGLDVVASVAYSPTAPVVAVGGNGEVVLFDMTDPARPATLDTLTGVPGTVGSVAFSPDGRLMAAGDEDGNTRVWDVTEPGRLRVLSGAKAFGSVESLGFAPGAATFFTADGSATGTFWAVRPRGAVNLLSTLSVPGGDMEAMALYRDGRALSVGTSGGTVSTWRVTDPGRPVRNGALTLPTTDVGVMAFSSDSRRVGVVGSGGQVTVTDRDRPARPVTLSQVRWPRAMALSPDGRILAVAGETTLMLWDLTVWHRPIRVATLKGTFFGTTVAFSPDGRTLAAGDDRTTTLWDVADRSAPAPLATLTGHGSPVDTVAFSPDGRTLASGGFDATVVLWDVTDRARPHRLATLPHEGSVASAAFSPDGRTFAAGLWEDKVAMWDITDRVDPIRLATLPMVGPGEADFVQFRRDGRTLAIGGNKNVTFWDFAELNRLRADPARHACATAGRGLTADEWARHIPEMPYRRTC